MHLSLDGQGRAHVDHVRAALPAEWRNLDIVIHAAPQVLAYRTRTRLHVVCDRGRPVVGMYESGTHDPVPVDRCAVLEPALEGVRRSLGALLEGSRGHGQVLMALGLDRIPVLDVRWSGDFAAVCFGRLERAIAVRRLAGARVTIGDASRPATVGDPTPWMAGADGKALRLAPGGFAQASEQTSAALTKHVARLVHGYHADKAVELYAGAGNLTILLAREVPGLIAVESSHEACEAARANLASRGLIARVVNTDAEEFAFSASTRVVVLDPPRTGARAVAQRLATSRVRYVVYVSCDPPTLARDLKILASSYQAQSVATFEMFPQTSHVESVVSLERKS
jgi:23S rRNA (uracil1939-C5)-methyltransferase